MKLKNQKKTGGQILIECLIKHSIDRVFCVPGESYLAALDAFYDFRTNFIFHEDLIKDILKLINYKGIVNIGGKSQSVYKFAKKYNSKV